MRIISKQDNTDTLVEQAPFCDDTLGNRIKSIRTKIGLTQQDFSEILNLSQAHISNIEANKDKPSGKVIKQICMAFGIDKEWLETGKGDMTKSAGSYDSSSGKAAEAQQEYENTIYIKIMSAWAKSGMSLKELSDRSGIDMADLAGFVSRLTFFSNDILFKLLTTLNCTLSLK